MFVKGHKILVRQKGKVKEGHYKLSSDSLT
jgi:hypothetical protein